MIKEYRQVKRQEKLSIQVAEQIIRIIVEGKLKDESRLPPERELCESFGVSRTVVREAVSVLEAKGLLTSLPGNGTYVRAMQGGDVSNSFGLFIATQSHSVSMKHLLEVRRVIEINTVQLAAERASAEDIIELEEILSTMLGLVSEPAAFAKKDFEFHVTLARASGNPLFEILLEPLADVILQGIYVGSTLPGIAEEACVFHTSVLEAIKDHDVSKAIETMAAHLKQTERVTSLGLRAIQEEIPESFDE